LTIVLGGWQASLNPDVCINYADFLCIGEGEEPFVDLVCRLNKKEKTANIENFYIKTTSRVIKNPVRQLPRDLSAFPIPLFEHKYSYIIENDDIENYEPYFRNSRYGTFVGRGCPHRCTYCSNSFMANSVYPKQWSKVRHRSLEHVKKELLTVKERLKQVRSVNFYDEVFTPKIEWIKDFFSWYKLKIDIPFYMFFFPGACNEEKAKILSDGGLKGVWIGVQSGSQRVRNEVFKRKYSNDQILKQAKIFHKYEVSVRYDFILDNPFETFEESLESIYLMTELPQPFSLNLFSLKYFPNTEITKMAEDAGFITEADKDDNWKKDRDTYTIHKDKGNLDSRFINQLALYISFLSGNQSLEDKKNDLHKLIDDYRHSKDISYVENLLKPFLS
jgi:anaerobic magnesium-protoporphyrin IX monomethyl ester cyclase